MFSEAVTGFTGADVTLGGTVGGTLVAAVSSSNNITWNVTVTGMAVRSGDLIHADRHGAVVIPEAVAAKIPAACDLLTRKEAVILDAAKKPGFNAAMLRDIFARMDDIH